MQASEAEHTLREVERVRRDTRRTLHPPWFPNLVTGAFFLGAALVGLIAHGSAVTGLAFGVLLRDAPFLAAAGALIAAGLVERAWERE